MPSHYEERLQQDLASIQNLVVAVGAAVGRAIDHAVQAVLTLDKDLAAATVLGDYAINRQTRELDRLCHAFVARHLPGAGHLRFVSAVLRLGIALERIGDYAATIGRTAGQLSTVPPPVVARDAETMAGHAHKVLHDAMRSFASKDVALAQATLASASQHAQYFDRVFADLVAEGEARSRPVVDLFALMATFNRLDRVIHQAKNVCEETLFVATGTTKGEKLFQILFVDAANAGPSQLAEHYTARAFPNSGRFRSAGWAPTEEVDPAYVRFAPSVGLDLGKAWPQPFAALREDLDDFQVVVGLGRDAREKLGRLPFHTTLLVWDFDLTSGPEAVYRELTPRIRDLLEKLRGPEAG